GFWRLADLDLSLHQLTGSYSESGVESVMEQGGGMGLAKNLNASNRLSLEASGHFLSASAKNTYTLHGGLRTAWPQNVSSDVEGGRELYYNARALNADVISHYADGSLRWRPPTDWRASAQTRLEDLSDDNHRASGM